MFFKYLNYHEKISLWMGIILFAAMVVLSGCDNKDSSAQNAAEEISEGIEDAGEELDRDRNFGEKAGDAIEDTGEEMQDMAK